MKRIKNIKNNVISGLLFIITTASFAGAPLWTFTPLTETTISVSSSVTTTIQYTVTNQSNKVHTLRMQPLQGVTQTTTGLGVCGNPFTLPAKASCTLSLQVNGSQLITPINDGPVVCEHNSTLQCYRPAAANILHITQTAPTSDAIISVTGSPLTLTTNGPTGSLTINNNSLLVAATNITSNVTGTALDGNVTETGNTCANVPPQGSCTLTYTPGNTVVAQTSFPIQGSNTNSVTAAIQIDASVVINTVNPSSGPDIGGASVTLTGIGFTGATGVTFGGTPATNINVVNSTTVTSVTPAHAIGAVDVVITTPAGSATQTNAYTYVTAATGQSAYGGTIGCLGGGVNNLIAATADNSTGIEWGGFGQSTGAISSIFGQANTTTIVSVLGNGSNYAAGLCNNYEVDSQGNSPCQAGNLCYNNWFLPAVNQLFCLYQNKADIGGFTNDDYWSSTESGGGASVTSASSMLFLNSVTNQSSKNLLFRVRCVSAF